MKLPMRNFILMVLMVAASSMALALRPTNKLAEHRPAFNLEAMIPSDFDGWREERQSLTQVIDPQVQEFVNQIYKQTLTRTYVHPKVGRIMLSIAYVESQADSFGVHLPEVCYPSQGFQISEQIAGSVQTGNVLIPVKRMVASLGSRIEPITYWVTVGEEIVSGQMQRKLVQMKYALRGDIPDGMLVRVSSISADRSSAYEIQARFISDFQRAAPQQLRSLLFGPV